MYSTPFWTDVMYMKGPTGMCRMLTKHSTIKDLAKLDVRILAHQTAVTFVVHEFSELQRIQGQLVMQVHENH